ncbi:hypothetical protein H2204_008652 [Knufia peltigerae]|uniref:Zn(2)-C6 fungal-type domain-containing protein n=1 Tax=Knufia peltigerae TaxID=1002370 RepID=A0AA38XZN3_9EURO|nr:hypothetical protein H2204_008652 [Knufia peltigerae]
MQQSNSASPSFTDVAAANGQADAQDNNNNNSSSSMNNNGPSPAQSSNKSTTGEKPSSETPRQITRKGRACLTCRKLKVKCGGPESGDGFGCQRCQRLGLECKMAKRLRVSLEDVGQTDPSLARLDRSVRAILEKLDMPSLESFGPGGSSAPGAMSLPATGTAKTTRENSRENSPHPESKNDIASAPMEGLYEATHLSALRSRTGGPPTERRLRKNFESDLIAQGVITIDEAERMLNLFKTSLSRYLYNATISPDRTLHSIRSSSSLLFTSIMAVSSLHIPGMEDIHNRSHRALRDLIASSMFDRSHTLEDVRALCIAAFWLPDLSWKLSGHCVRMATELNLHQAFFKVFHSPSPPEDREATLERARLWYLLYVLDHHFSIAYGRPPVTTEMQAIRETDVLLSSPECTLSDRRVISQVALFRILSRAYDAFGLEAGRSLGDDDETLIIHARFLDDLGRYREHFRALLPMDEFVGGYSVIGLDLHYHFCSMLLNSLALRGRSMTSIGGLPHRLRPLAFHAIESAHQILEIVLGEPDLRRALVGVPLYLHAMIAFAVVFLIKMSAVWDVIGVSTDAHARTKPLIRGTIATLRECKAGNNHILYKMATGFQRLMERNPNDNSLGGGSTTTTTTTNKNLDLNRTSSFEAATQHHHLSNQEFPDSLAALAAVANGHASRPSIEFGSTATHLTPTSHHQDLNRNNGAFDTQQPQPQPQPPSYGLPSSHVGSDWQLDDDMLWNTVGTEYDLLANAPDTDMNFYAF